MQENSDSIKELGILAKYAYNNYDPNDSNNNSINDDRLEHSYTVLETQDTLLEGPFPTLFGFQAMLLLDNDGKYVIAFRGTENEPVTYQTFADLASDFSMGIGSFSSQMFYALDFVKKAMDKYANQGLTTDNLTFTGHSLGGSLAEVAGYTFGSDTYTYNAFGAADSVGSDWGYDLALNTLGITSAQNIDDITNIVSLGGEYTDEWTGRLTEMLGEYLGEVIFVKDSAGGDPDGRAPHGMSELNTSISVYNTLIDIFPNMNGEENNYTLLTENIALIRKKDQQVPRFLKTLKELVQADPSDDAAELAWNILTKVPPSGITITWLNKDTTQSFIEGQAYNQEGLYSILKLNPFVVCDCDYAHLNTDDYLEKKSYSDNFIEDRSTFLYYTMNENTTDIEFEDKTLDYKIEGTSQGPKYIFGKDGNDGDITGAIVDDHLYGMGGDDILIGHSGDDFLEGGKGQDTMYGGNNNDTFFLAGEDEAYDTFNGGDGQDTIQGSSEDDTIRVHDFSGENRVETIDGGAGENIIAGTDMSDIIDLSDTELINIEEIRGGGGVDQITGSAGDDKIYGEGGMDILSGGAGVNTLYGGEGLDTYIVGAGSDTVIDSDNSGIIKDQDGNILGGAWNELEGGGYEHEDLGITAQKNGSSFVIQLAGGTATINSFESGNFGVNLVDEETTPTTIVPQGDENDNYLFDHNHNDQVDIKGHGGNDLIFGSPDDDTLSGGDGSDWIIGSGGKDTIDGGDGNDYISGVNGAREVRGGEGDDIISAVSEELLNILSYADGEFADGFTFDNIWSDYISNFQPVNSETLHVTTEGYLGVDYGGGLKLGTYTGASSRGGDWTYKITISDAGDGTWNWEFEYFHPSDPEPSYPWQAIAHYKGPANSTDSSVLYGDAGNDLLVGNQEADVLDGGDDNDFLVGNGGDDVLKGGAGDDSIIGGDGDDIILAGEGNDFVYGETGSDSILGGAGNDKIYGDSYSTTLSALDGDDFIDGGAGDDEIFGQGGDDSLFGGDGNDKIWGDYGDLSGDGNDFISGGAGNDILMGLGGDDTVNGDAGEDNISGGDGNDILSGGEDIDQMTGNAGDDILNGDAGDDSMWGGDGNDSLFGGDDNDTLVGDDGDDILDGGSGNDKLYGGEGNNILIGGAGDDELYGGDGDDTLIGGAGNDFFRPGTGNDTMDGGEGDDTYYYASGSGIKRIADDSGFNRLCLLNANLNMLSLSLGSLMIGTGTAGDELHLDGVNYDNLAETTPIDVIEFANGQTMTTAEVIEAVGIDIAATEEADNLTGTSGRDNINALAGDDIVNGRGGNDILEGGAGNDTVYAGEGDDSVAGGIGDDTIYGNEGNDILDGGEGNDILVGEDGADTLDGGLGEDTMTGGAGDDIYVVDNTNDVIVENIDEGVDKVNTSMNYTLSSNVENLQLTEGSTAITGIGNELDNVITGNSLDNNLQGLAGVDTLYGGAGNDEVSGGEGDDTLDGGLGEDTMAGGLGDDTYIIDNTNDVIIENIDEGVDQVNASSDYTLISNIENLQLNEGSTATNGTGNELDNVITGNSLDNNLQGLAGVDTLYGGTGNDLLDGGVGADTMSGGSGDDQYIVDDVDDIIMETGSGVDQVISSASYTLSDNVENLDLVGLNAENGTGNSGQNIINGNTLNNILDGQDGNDELHGGDGDDYLDGGDGDDQLVGGLGNDTYVVDNEGDVVTELSDQGIDTVESSISYELSENLENLSLVGPYSGYSGIGNAKDNIIRGQGGDNILLGHGGDDILIGGFGDDILYGGEGDDYLDGSTPDLVMPSPQADQLFGGSGNDTYVVDSTDDVVTELSDQGTDLVESRVNYELGDHLENLTLIGIDNISGIGNAKDNIITGNSGDNYLSGLGGDDVIKGVGGANYLYGGEGDDTLIGGESVDYLYGEEGNDTLTGGTGDDSLYGGEENDTVYGGEGADTLDGGLGEDTMTGGTGDDSLYGGEENDTVYGGEGADTLDGGLGEDTMTGGTGDDTYIVDNINDVIVEDIDEGVDQINTSLDYSLGLNVENLRLTGGSTAINGIGNELDNSIDGNSLDNNLQGLAGNDNISGGDGNDLLDGGAGADVMSGGEGDDQYLVDDVADEIIEESGSGTDHVSSSVSYTLSENVERLDLIGPNAVNGTGSNTENIINGNSLNNILDGQGGDDELNGGAGDDTLLGGDGDDRLYGGAGADSLTGGAGNDTYVMDDANDVIIELADEGLDTIETNSNITLQANLENAVLTGTENLNAYGNELDNVLVGNVANNMLDGGSGSDSLYGNDGDDTYYTDSDGDIIYESIDQGIDTEIRSHESSFLLSSNVENLILTGAALKGYGNSLDNIITGNDADNSLFGFGGDDSIEGNAGNDTIFGADGNDHLFGNDGNDYLDGGAGINTLRGGAGNDLYVYRADGGVYEIDNSDGGTDWLLFADDLSMDRLSFIKSGDNLVVRVDGDEAHQVTVTNWFLGEEYQIDYIQPAGASGIPASQIESLLSGSGAFDTVVDGTEAGEQLVGTSGTNQLNGEGGDDQLFGLAGNDELNGGTGNDYLDGGDGDDVQNGGEGNDQLGGDAGNDTLTGGAGDDIYVYKAGSGADTIDNQGGGTDWLIFNDSISSDRLSYHQTGDNLIVRVDNSESTQVTVTDWFLGEDYQLSYIQPSGGSGIPASQINDMFTTTPPDDTEIPPESTFDTVVEGTTGNEQLVGTNGMDLLKAFAGDDQLFGLGGNDFLVAGEGNDYLDGGSGDDVQLGEEGNDQLGGDAGNDILRGGAGNDTYVYRPGSDSDTIINNDGGTDWLIFTDDISADRLTYHQSDDNLLIKIDGSDSTMVTVKDWFKGSEYQVAYIQPAGGYGIPASQIDGLLEPAPTRSSAQSSGLLEIVASTGTGDDYFQFKTSSGSPLAGLGNGNIGVGSDFDKATSGQENKEKNMLFAV